MQIGENTYTWRDEELLLLRQIARRQLMMYDYVCYVPIEFPFSEGHLLHQLGSSYRDLVDNHLRRELLASRATIVEIRGSVEQRVGQILRLLKTKSVSKGEI
jgi:hypothetical protein